MTAGIVAGLWLVGLVSERPLGEAARQPSPQGWCGVPERRSGQILWGL